MTEQEILKTLDNSNDGYYCSFVELGHVYSYLIDLRLNVFRGDNDRWAIAIERLGYNPRAGAIFLDIYYFGNCLINLEQYNDRPSNYYSVYPIDLDSFNNSIDGETLKADAKIWLVRGQQIELSHNKQDYKAAGVDLKEYEPNEISAEEVGRLIVLKHNALFRATDQELYKSIPTDLKKILTLDEWYHKDFQLINTPTMTNDNLMQAYELNKNLTGLSGIDFETFAAAFRQQESLNDDWNNDNIDNNSPSSYETWQQIAKVIATGDIKYYRPTIQSNTHWINWPDSGSL
jgi:hypothetical protein